MFSSPPPGNETPGASRPEPTAGSLLLQPMLLASLLGASVESAVLLVDAGGAGALASVAALGLWLLLGLALTLGLHGALWLALGKGGAERLASGCRRGLGRWWLERGLEPDRERLARALAGALVGLGWLLSSWLGARHLIEHRHGAGLIAAAALGLQLASIPLYLIAFGALRRALRW
ncbi:MAG: hypothetical protein OEY14_08085, partial [Myxococcales bacterium]|nr:hypothetical protein [Myxococcales bacterium]